MKIKSFRIKNYRSLKDSGYCILSNDNITVLAGMNESGKTTIVEALEDFNADKTIRDEAKPIENPKAVPEINIIFKIDEETLNEIFGTMKIEKKVDESINILESDSFQR